MHTSIAVVHIWHVMLPGSALCWATLLPIMEVDPRVMAKCVSTCRALVPGGLGPSYATQSQIVIYDAQKWLTMVMDGRNPLYAMRARSS